MWNEMERGLETGINILVTIAVPAFICVGVIRLLLTPVFVGLEYRLPHFPPDRYGFSQEERLVYAQRARRYLLKDADIEYLGSLEFEDGSQLFNDRELRHMEDVKRVLQGAFQAFWGTTAVLFLGGVWKWRRERFGEFWTSASWGGWLTVTLLVTVLLLSVLSFRAFFVVFHRLFFEGNTWLFRYSDTLIRLFPIRFWQDTFLVFGLLAAGGGLVLGWSGRKVSQEKA